MAPCKGTRAESCFSDLQRFSTLHEIKICLNSDGQHFGNILHRPPKRDLLQPVVSGKLPVHKVKYPHCMDPGKDDVLIDSLRRIFTQQYKCGIKGSVMYCLVCTNGVNTSYVLSLRENVLFCGSDPSVGSGDFPN